MNWKEQLDETIFKAVEHNVEEDVIDVSRTKFQDFISTKIIEKLIDDIPENLSVYFRDDIENGVSTDDLKQQLRDKWL